MERNPVTPYLLLILPFVKFPMHITLRNVPNVNSEGQQYVFVNRRQKRRRSIVPQNY